MPIKPSTGPAPRMMYSCEESIVVRSIFSNSMLSTVIKKPIEVDIVSAVPFASGGADWATRVENCGESAVTAIPHVKRIIRNTGKLNPKINGDKKQQAPEIVNAVNATFALPKYFER